MARKEYMVVDVVDILRRVQNGYSIRAITRATGMIGKGLICLDKGGVCTEKGNYLSDVDIIGCSLLLDGRNIGCPSTGPI